MNIPANEQIAAILQAQEWKLAKNYNLHDVSDIQWSVSKDDVKRYIEQNEFPKGWVYFSEETFDGVYLLASGCEWKVYYKERGIIHSEENFKTREDAMDYLLTEYYLKRYGIA